MTAAHCVKNKDIAGVRVGDYNINTKEDCQGEGPFYVCENYIQVNNTSFYHIVKKVYMYTHTYYNVHTC